jgi:hypothetical protein
MVVVGSDGTHRVVLLAGEGPPDLSIVEGLALFQLMARRAGDRMWLEDVSSALGELLDLAGLRREVTGQAGLAGRRAALRREVGGQAEGREEVLGVQEKMKGCDTIP